MESLGFLRIRNSPDIQIYTKDCLVDPKGVIHTSSVNECEKYIDGSKFKIMHRNMQPNNPRLWLSKTSPYLIDIQQQISGPSSEIIFKSMEIQDPERLQMVAECLEKIENRWCGECKGLLDTFPIGVDLHSKCSENLASAIAQGERCLSEPNVPQDENILSKDELVKLLLKYQSFCLEVYEKSVSVMNLSVCINSLLESQADSKYEGKFNSLFSKGLIRDVYNKSLFEEWNHLSLLVQLKKMNDWFENLLVEMDFFKDPIHLILLIESERDEMQSKIQLAVQQVKQMVNKCGALNEDACKDKESSSRESTISFDNVSCFHCPFWPKIASEWTTRKRQWPSQGQIQMILDAGCFVVAKPFKAESPESFLDWRWSFSSAEISIANFRTDSMKFCYFIFKSIFYRFVKKESEEGKYLPSYIAKTCMLYASEELGAPWFDDNSTAHCIISLLQNLRQSLTSGIVPHYFIPKLNLLTGMPESVIDRAVSTLTDLLESPTNYFIFKAENLERIEGIKNEVEQLYPLTTASLKSTDPLQYFDSVTESGKDLLLNRIEGYRCARLVDLYNIWSKMNNFRYTLPAIKGGIEAQQMYYSFPGNGNIEKDLRFQENLKNYKQSEKELSQLEESEPVKRLNFISQFAKINNLMGKSCRICQKCFGKIDCNSWNCFHCIGCNDSKCQHVECASCYTNAGINKEEEHHRMIKSNKCLKHCSAWIDEEDIGKDMLMDVFMLTSKLQGLKQKIKRTAPKMGYSNKKLVSFFGGQGRIVEEESQSLFNTIYKKGIIFLNKTMEHF